MIKQVLFVHTLCLFLALCAAAVPQQSRQPVASTYGVFPSQDFFNEMCMFAADGTELVPWPLQIDGICSNLNLDDPQDTGDVCPIFSLVKMLISSVQSLVPMRCAADGIPMPSSATTTGYMLPQPLPTQIGGGGLPPSFIPPVASALLQAEGPTYYWLYKHIMRLAAWAPCNALGNSVAWQKPDGWQLLQMMDAAEDLSGYGLQATSMPIMAVMRRNSSSAFGNNCRQWILQHPQLSGNSKQGQHQQDLCSGDQLLLLIRGTTTAYEWLYDLDYSLKDGPQYGRGQMHSGFLNVANQLWEGGLEALLDEQLVKGSGIKTVTFSGHSLGGAIAALLAARTEKYLMAAFHRRRAIQLPLITAVLFGSPNTGDQPFVADYNRRINTRNIEFAADIATQVPCVGTMLQCTSEVASNGTSSKNVTIKHWAYDRLGGRIRIEPAGMPHQKAAWGQLSVYTQDDLCDNMFSLAGLMEASHMCSYMCSLSATAATTGDKGEWCLLWDDEGKRQTGDATFCMDGFPSGTGTEKDFPLSPQFPSTKDEQKVIRRSVARLPRNK